MQTSRDNQARFDIQTGKDTVNRLEAAKRDEVLSSGAGKHCYVKNGMRGSHRIFRHHSPAPGRSLFTGDNVIAET